MMRSLTFASNAAYTVALLLVLSVNTKAKPIRYVLCALVLLSKPLFLHMTLPVCHIFIDMTACIFFFHNKNNDFCSLAFNAIYSVFLFILVLGVSSSIIALVLPSWHRSMSYEIFIILLLLAVGLLYKLNKVHHKQPKQPKVVMIASMTLEILVIAAYLAISNIFHDLELKQFSMLVLLIVSILVIAFALMRFISKKEAETRILLLKAEQNEEMRRIYQRVIEFEHLHSNFTQIAYKLLKKKNYRELNELFEQQIIPMLEVSDYGQELEKIKSTVIREQIHIALSTAAMMPNVSVQMQIINPVHLKQEHVALASKLLSEFFTNAFDSLKEQQDGLLLIELLQVEQVCSIKIANSITESDKVFQRIINMIASAETGNGRKMIFDITKHILDLKHFETIENDPNSNRLLYTQNIIFNDDED